MTKVIKEEFKKLESLKISDDSFTRNTSLEIFHKEFICMSRMDDDLFTYEVEIPGLANIPCDLKKEDESEQHMTNRLDDDMEYDPGDNEVELTDEESSDSDDEYKVTEIFMIDTNVFDFETPMCRAFKEFNYLSQIDPDVLTKDIDGFKTYEEAYIVGNTLRYQDLEWYKTLEDGKLKDKALQNKAILEGMIDEDDESHKEVIMEYLVKISKKARILELKRRHLKITVLTPYTPYPSKKIWRICAFTSQEPRRFKTNTPYPGELHTPLIAVDDWMGRKADIKDGVSVK
uniref:Uncharacterized protein n=1 Tax=Tanacetum cinerariifolium TaxID=118510 RepID=A0A6L2MDY4_TANCI|nr:hypothetical protein [Tanacetum cinerariifolium]